MRVIAVAGAKGGVGKTSIAVNIACWAACDGIATLLWDLDPQGSASHCLRVPPRRSGATQGLFGGKHNLDDHVCSSVHPDLDVVPADSDLRDIENVLARRKWPAKAIRKMLQPVSEDYDLAVLDCPPGLGLLAEAAFSAASVVVVPVVPSPLSARSLDQVGAFVEERGLDTDVLAVLSMVDRRKVLHNQMLAALDGDDRFATAVVPLSSAVERMGLEQVPSVLSSPRSLGSKAIGDLWKGLRVSLDLGD
ncbi:MAG: ParA family protein [Microthrixaceae bacterium]